MPRFLFAALPAAGHVHPTLPIVQALTARGHTVGYASGPAMSDVIAPLVSRFFPVGPRVTAEVAYEWWPELGRLRGLRRMDFMVNEILYPFVADSSRKVLDAIESFKPDALVFDSYTYPASIVAEMSGLPWATTTVLPGFLEGKDAYPMGLPLAYPPNPLVRMALPLLHRVVRWAGRRHDDRFNAIRAEFDLPPIRDSYRNSTISPYLVLALAPWEFEYPRESWEPTVHFVGPALWDVPHDYEAPDWLDDLPGARPLVYATIGTVQSIYQTSFFGTLFEAARGLDADVVVTTGDEVTALPTPPDNVRVERYVPNSLIIPKAQLVVHHGGLGTALGTLLNGKPALVVPFTDDQPANAQRIRWLGAGTDVDPWKATAAELRAAIEAALASTELRARAAALGQELQGYDAGASGAALLERLAETQAPVHRNGAAGP